MNRPRIKSKPALVYSVRTSDISNVQVLVIKTKSEEIREKLEAMFSPRTAV